VPNCLLLDVNLPDLNGLDLQERISFDRTDMPIIFMTADGAMLTSAGTGRSGNRCLTRPPATVICFEMPLEGWALVPIAMQLRAKG
jgi:DNA-binding response OmpR family regulator